MTTYTAITDAETGFEKPVTISLMRRLRDNPLAIQQGDATAPNILLGVVAKSALGGVGTHAFCIRAVVSSSAPITAGTSYSGSELRYSGADSQTGGGTPSGTWRALGTAGTKTVGGTSYSYATLFQRIS
jgi:hypothetical protein